MVDLGNILGGLSRIVGGVKTLLPFAKAMGGPLVGKVADFVAIGIDIASNIKERIDQGEIIVGSSDPEELRDIILDLQVVNDELAEYIAKS